MAKLQAITIQNKYGTKTIPLLMPIDYLALHDRNLTADGDLTYSATGSKTFLQKYMDKIPYDLDFFEGLDETGDEIRFENGSKLKVVKTDSTDHLPENPNYRTYEVYVNYIDPNGVSKEYSWIIKNVTDERDGETFSLKYYLVKWGDSNGVEHPTPVGESNIQQAINEGTLSNIPLFGQSVNDGDYAYIPYNNDLLTEVGGIGGYYYNMRESLGFGKHVYYYYNGFNTQHTRICEFYDAIKRSEYEVEEGGKDYGETSIKGGQDGTLDTTSDIINDDYLPNTNAVSSGLVKLYKLSTLQLKAFADYLYSAPTEIIEHLQKLFVEPMQSILQLSLLNYNPTGTTGIIVICGKSTGVAADKISNQFVLLDCGNLKIDKYYGNSLDYAPYTKVNLHLFGVGTVQLNTDDVMDKTLNIKYKIDLLSGACIVFVSVDGSVMYVYQGSISSQMPITGNDSKSLYTSVVSAVVSGASAIATGGASIPISGMVASGLSVMGSKENITRGGSITGSASLLDVKKPFVTIVRPIQSLPQNFKHFKGYTSNITETLSNVSGYTEIEYIDLQGVDATKEEKEMLQSVLKNGFYI